MLDQNLQNADMTTEEAIRETEWNFKIKADLTDQVIQKLEEAGWSLEFTYLDNGNNRFVVQKQGEDFIKEVQEQVASKQNVIVRETVGSLPKEDDAISEENSESKRQETEKGAN